MKISLILFLTILPLALADLRVGFYQPSCPNAESIIFGVVQSRFNTDESITAALLRMHFHDCFVRGCDASILIDTTSQNQAEKDAGPNLTVRGFELIDQIKKALEAACPSTVSCADIIAVATRDAVALAGGPKYPVPTGRRDGLVSKAGDVNLPGPSETVSQAFQTFKSKGLTLNEMVTLLGAHTVGVAHCNFFQDRLPNDPSMNSTLAASLVRTCANSNSNPTAFLDQGTAFAFDNVYYQQLLLKKGIMTIDQELATDSSSSGFVSSFARDANAFSQSFANAMVKMGSIGALVGIAGEVRTNCRAFNPPRPPPVPSPSKTPPSPPPVPSPSKNPPTPPPVPSPSKNPPSPPPVPFPSPSTPTVPSPSKNPPSKPTFPPSKKKPIGKTKKGGPTKGGKGGKGRKGGKKSHFH